MDFPIRNKHKMGKVREEVVVHICAGDPNSTVATTSGIYHSTVWRVKKRYEETGQHSDCSCEGCPHSAHTKTTIMVMRNKIKRNPQQSMNKMAKEHLVSQSTMPRIVNKDLAMRSRAVTKCQIDSHRCKQGRQTGVL